MGLRCPWGGTFGPEVLTCQIFRHWSLVVTVAACPGGALFLRVLRTVFGAVLVAVIAIVTTGAATPMEAEPTPIPSVSSPAELLAARVADAQALLAVDPASARGVAESLLGDLTLVRTAVAPELDPDNVEAVALTLVGLRNRAIEALLPAVEGAGARFIALVADGAVWSDWRWGVPSSVTIAQAILESGWGKSAPGYNLFGLKGEGPAGSTLRAVIEYRGGVRGRRTAHFRAYEDFSQAMRDHGRILGEAERYAHARTVSHDLVAYARALTGTYASDPRYGSKLLELIRVRKLDQYDFTPPPPIGE